ncbi:MULTISPECIES: ATP-binding protein [Motilimonas]|uniref:histidine kinase n=1 Tax=Motilimonas cestriensis TaxID=2742685 RepID=A0ABS8WEJ9_9GAMM|nr:MULTISPECIES: ATP-binding protein [Motilimonas]MCE0559163.1 two-component sensor histidine kinase [Motilimonas sp. E26]MCE2595775.1 two-component sensor histidine kinase [Motilimonas cestriensis]MDO6525217.1 ATP-binding protein [Motilimonas sp. 1_MG-2023]
MKSDATKPRLANTLVVRLLATLLLVIISAQFLTALIWYRQGAAKENEGLISTVNSLALSAASTVAFFSSLPLEYRHLTLNQLRKMGGSRFFVSLNNHEIAIQALPDSQRKKMVLSEVRKVLNQELSTDQAITLEFTDRENLRVFNTEVRLDEVPQIWANYSLSLGELNPPILVMQIEISPTEWLYLAAILPAPFVLLDTPFMDTKQWFFMGLSSLLLVFFTWLVVRREIRPIAKLANAASAMTEQLDTPQLAEQGSEELITATRAFNKMSLRIKNYLRDRDMLFSAISHDLKTPIACLRLRTEMLPDEATRKKFENALNELDFMVKGALQCIRDTDLHEDIEPVDINHILQQSAELYGRYDKQVTIHGQVQQQYLGKPLALKRLLNNLVENGIKYGKRVEINITELQQQLHIDFRDYGDGIPVPQQQQVFEPYFRLSKQKQEGTGLGLTIARSIARSHGGDISLRNHHQQGLIVSLTLPEH